MELARWIFRSRLSAHWRCSTWFGSGQTWGGLLAVCFVLALPSLAAAQMDFEGGTIRTKDLGYGALDINYFNEHSASSTGGALHIEVVSLTGPSPRDRNLEIVFSTNFLRGGPRSGTSIRFPFRLPEGAQRAQWTVPYNAPGQANHPGNRAWVMLWDVAVLEDGRDVRASRSYRRSGTPGSVASPATGRGADYHLMTTTSSGWSMLRLVEDGVVPTSLQPEIYRLLLATGGDTTAALTQSFVAKDNFGVSSDLQNVNNVRALSTAPDYWQYYLQFHCVALDHATLKRMQQQRPTVALALKQYVAAGGSVLSFGQGSRAQKAHEPGEKLMDQWLSAGAAPDRADSGSDGAPTIDSADWVKVIVPVEPWWNRGSSATSPTYLRQTAPMAMPMEAALYGALPMSPSGPAEVGMAAPGVPLPPPRSSSASAAKPQSTSASSPQSKASAPAPIDSSQPLTAGGVARDTLIAIESYSLAEFGVPVIIVDKFVEVITGNGGPTVMSQVTTANGFASSVFEVEEVVMPLRDKLEEIVAELQSRDAIGCSWRSYGLGKIGVVEPDLQTHSIESLSVLVHELLTSSASARINSMHDTAWPWRNLISSVGKPPVWTFCAFVLLFGLLLGPGLLVFTGWMGRRSLLIFLVPFVSLVATSLIAAYEILYEGFDTSIRVSSVVTIDQPTGQGFAWSRQTYFSGWPPGSGLEFPTNVYFRPIDTDQGYRGANVEHPRRSVGNIIDVEEDRLRWMGWLSAREQQQMLIGHPVKPPVPLEVTPIRAQRIKLKNLTNETLPFAAVRDATDWYYLAVDLAPGAEIECQGQIAYDVGVELTRFRAKHIPAAPIELQGSYGWGWNSRYVAYPTDASTEEMLDHVWHKYMTENLELPRYGFVTLQERSDVIHVPLEGNITESKHLVVGRLVW